MVGVVVLFCGVISLLAGLVNIAEDKQPKLRKFQVFFGVVDILLGIAIIGNAS